MSKVYKYFGGTQVFYLILHNYTLSYMQSSTPVLTYAGYEKKHNTKMFNLNICIIVWKNIKHLLVQ